MYSVRSYCQHKPWKCGYGRSPRLSRSRSRRQRRCGSRRRPSRTARADSTPWFCQARRLGCGWKDWSRKGQPATRWVDTMIPLCYISRMSGNVWTVIYSYCCLNGRFVLRQNRTAQLVLPYCSSRWVFPRTWVRLYAG